MSDSKIHDGVLRELGGTGTPPLSTLVISGNGRPDDAEIRRMVDADLMPDPMLAEAPLNPVYVDDRYLASLTGLYGRLLRALPFRPAQLVEVVVHGRRYDVILTWSDLPSVLVAGLLRLMPRRRPALVTLLFWPSKPKKAIALGLVNRSIDRIVAPAPLQREFVINMLRTEKERVIDGAHAAVDVRFWRPIESEQTTICAVGQEMRDYATLLEALAPIGIPCHIAVGANMFGTTSDRWWRDSLAPEALPAGVTVGHKDFLGLRELYARSRFVVVPLIPSDSDNGITVILEAFASGRAVIATETPGQTGVLQDGVNCLRVPPFDPERLREAILRLWNDPELCARLGAAGRELAVSRHSLQSWSRLLVRAADEAVAARRVKAERRWRTARRTT